MGNLIASITNNDETDIVTQYQYDKANRMTQMITGLTAYSEKPSGGAVTQYSYNDLGYLAKITDPMGFSQIYNSYDYAGNLLSMTDKNGNEQKNVYGPFGLTKTYFINSLDAKEYTYDNLGQITEEKSINANGDKVSKNYIYDNFGRIIQTISNDDSIQNYTYDANSNVATYELIKDDVVKNKIEYDYNKLNQLTMLKNNSIITSYTYDANGNLTDKSLNTGVKTNYTYNKAGLMTYMESKKDGEVYTYSDCTYLLNGLLQKVYMPYDGYNDAECKIKNYNYDGMGRLINEHIVNATGIPLINSYKYDLRGNRIEKIESIPDDSTTETITYKYDLNNRLISEASEKNDEYAKKDEYSSTRYYYDANGNMTAKQRMSAANMSNNAVLSGRSSDTGLSIYRYDAFNRLSNYNNGSVEARYTYNVDNLRASKIVNRDKTTFVWNGQNLAGETNDSITDTYTYDMTGVHIANQDGTAASYLKDYHGNIVGKTDVAGVMLQLYDGRMDYDAFGNQWIGEVPDPFGYCGEYYDNESGLIYLRNRYYDSEDGRFLSEDPAKDGYNWYIYCSGNPVMFVDPSGLDDYIFYTTGENSDFSKQAEWQNKRLEEEGRTVIMRPVNSVDEFQEEWNIMGYNYETGETVEVDMVVIYSHGNENCLIFEDGSSTNAISASGTNSRGEAIPSIYDLKKKNIGELHILSCNSGHLSKYAKDKYNTASAFSTLVSGITYGYDGNVSFGENWFDSAILGNYSSRLSKKQDSFHKIAKVKGNDRNPMGKLAYRNGKHI